MATPGRQLHRSPDCSAKAREHIGQECPIDMLCYLSFLLFKIICEIREIRGLKQTLPNQAVTGAAVDSVIGSQSPLASERYAASITLTDANASAGSTRSDSVPRTAPAKFSS